MRVSMKASTEMPMAAPMLRDSACNAVASPRRCTGRVAKAITVIGLKISPRETPCNSSVTSSVCCDTSGVHSLML